MSIPAQLAEARLLLGKVSSMAIKVAEIEQLAKINGACDDVADEVASYIEKCDRFCADYDKRLTKGTK